MLAGLIELSQFRINWRAFLFRSQLACISKSSLSETILSASSPYGVLHVKGFLVEINPNWDFRTKTNKIRHGRRVVKYSP